MMNLGEFYSRYPYPPWRWWMLPRTDDESLSRFRPPDGSSPRRILIAGCGTLETLLIARAHPDAKEVVALDLSPVSVQTTRKRILLARWLGWRLPPIKVIHADLLDFKSQSGFDLIFANHVLHHLPDPADGMSALTQLLQQGGWMRVITYPRQSRHWMRETGKYLRSQGLNVHSPNLRTRAWQAIRRLSPENVVRLCFESQPETQTATGIADAFLNPMENPLSPREWGDIVHTCGLVLVREDQNPTSRSDFLEELLPQVARTLVDPFDRLQILDDLLELCANPVWWFRRDLPRCREFRQHEGPRDEDMRTCLVRAHRVLLKHGSSLLEAFNALKIHVGPRVTAPPNERPLPGLSLLDHEALVLDVVAAAGAGVVGVGAGADGEGAEARL